MYKSISKHGGVLHFRCPHGVCVYYKLQMRQESARDHLDGLMCFKEQPKVLISDIASQIAHHGEVRCKGMFRPHKGMLFEFSEHNNKLLQDGNLKPVNIDLKADSYCSLHDRFHLHGKKEGTEKTFRDLKYCNNLLQVNTRVAEQQNKNMAKDRHFVTQMGLSNFQFISRMSVSMHNKDKNDEFLMKLKSFGGTETYQVANKIPGMTRLKACVDGRNQSFDACSFNDDLPLDVNPRHADKLTNLGTTCSPTEAMPAFVDEANQSFVADLSDHDSSSSLDVNPGRADKLTNPVATCSPTEAMPAFVDEASQSFVADLSDHDSSLDVNPGRGDKLTNPCATCSPTEAMPAFVDEASQSFVADPSDHDSSLDVNPGRADKLTNPGATCSPTEAMPATDLDPITLPVTVTSNDRIRPLPAHFQGDGCHDKNSGVYAW